MDKRLLNKEILIGRDPEKSCLLMTMEVNGKTLLSRFGAPNSVPNSVSRCLPKEKKAHCSVEVLKIEDDSIELKIINLKEGNSTFLNNRAVITKIFVLKDSDLLKLGEDNFTVKLVDILDSAFMALNKVLPPEFSIKHLEKIWDDFHTSEMKLAKRKQRDGIISRLYLPLMLISGGIGALASWLAQGDNLSDGIFVFLNVIKYLMGAAAVVFLFLGLYKTVTDHSLEEKDQMVQDLRVHYICPNPECHRYLQQKPYEELRQYKNCPYCKVKWTED